MPYQGQYIKFSTHDRKLLKLIAVQKWLKVLKRFLISFSLPFICTFVVLVFINYIILRAKVRGHKGQDFLLPNSWDDLELFFLLYPVFAIIAIANIATFLWTIPPFYYDLLRGRKKQIEFLPQPYTIPESANYYIQTGIPIKPFIEVDYEQYMYTDYSIPYVMEVMPVTKIYLGIKPKYEVNSLDVPDILHISKQLG